MLFATEELQFGYNDVVLFEDVTLSFAEGERVGLIGANGAGKTTFLHCILGDLTPTKGEVYRKQGVRIGVLRQKDGLHASGTVWEEMLRAFDDLFAAEAKMRELETQMAALPEGSIAYRTLADAHRKCEDYFLSRDGYHIDVRIKTVLGGMGFADKYDRPVAPMSGGEKTRLALCKLLLDDLDLLVLDEPTNHLDVATLQWLETYLSTYKGGLLIVSHDRYFLDKIVGKIWDLEGKTVREWRGNYSKARAVKTEVLAAQEKQYERQQEQVASMLDYAQRNIARASTSKSAKSRLHRIEGMDLIEKPITYVKPPHFSFGITQESNRDVLTVSSLHLTVGGKCLIDQLSFSLQKGERLAIVGPNGVGKSTLVKTLLGLINNQSDHYNPVPDPSPSACVGGVGPLRFVNGAVRYGKNVSVGYYDQENINLDDNAHVLDDLWFRFPRYTQTYVRSILANLLFGPEDMTKTVRSLSGGEKAKLGFALLMCETSNLLLLDEPTNHLDLAARDSLEQALCRYAGTVLFVSHDRYFINAVATRVLELSPVGARSYEGNYDAYLSAKAREAEYAKQEQVSQKAIDVADKPKTKYNKVDRRKEAIRRDAVNRLEREITQVEARLGELNDLLCSGTGDYKQIAIWDKEIQALTAKEEELFAALSQWE